LAWWLKLLEAKVCCCCCCCCGGGGGWVHYTACNLLVPVGWCTRHQLL
jgi:hypothetical protein